MKLEKLEQVRSLLRSAKTLKTIEASYLEKIKDSSCDKHNFKFGGDDRFSVFQVNVFLDVHTGYYGNSSCSSMGSVDKEHARRFLNASLNKHRTLILQTMAEFAEQEAATLKDEAVKEIASAQTMLDSILEEAA